MFHIQAIIARAARVRSIGACTAYPQHLMKHLINHFMLNLYYIIL